MGSFGMTEIVIILAVGFLLFGAKKLPEMGRSLGKAIREFKTGLTAVTDIPEEKDTSKKKEV